MIVLDTHVLIWHYSEPTKLSTHLGRTRRRARDHAGRAWVPEPRRRGRGWRVGGSGALGGGGSRNHRRRRRRGSRGVIGRGGGAVRPGGCCCAQTRSAGPCVRHPRGLPTHHERDGSQRAQRAVIVLADVNVLGAIAWTSQSHHRIAHDWFANARVSLGDESRYRNRVSADVHECRSGAASHDGSGGDRTHGTHTASGQPCRLDRRHWPNPHNRCS